MTLDVENEENTIVGAAVAVVATLTRGEGEGAQIAPTNFQNLYLRNEYCYMHVLQWHLVTFHKIYRERQWCVD